MAVSQRDYILRVIIMLITFQVILHRIRSNASQKSLQREQNP